MKKLFLNVYLALTLSLGGIPASLLAQENQKTSLSELLALSEDQAKQLKSTRKAHRQELRSLKENTDLSQEEKMEALQKLKSQHEEVVRSILSEDQFEKLQELVSSRKMQKGPRLKDVLEPEQRKALGQEIRAYQRENIAPIILGQRQKLEASLDASSKQKIEEVRLAMAELKAERKALKNQVKEEGSDLSPEEKQAKRQQFKEQVKTQMETLRPVLEQYGEEIESLREEISAQSATWKEDIQNILLKYFENTQEIPRRSIKRMQKPGHINKMRFLLLDPNKDLSAKSAKGRLKNLYPNPSTGARRLDYDLKEDTFVRIQLLDAQGNLVRPLEEGPKKAGSHSMEFDTGLLQPGAYVIRLEYDGKQETKRVQIR